MAIPPFGSQPQRFIGLDVLRSAAILLVMSAHWSNNISAWIRASPPPRIFFAGGLGVSMFFALSGFLIGRILIEQGRNAPTLQNLRIFLVRRWMRTLPLYFIMLAVLLVLVPPPELPLRYALKYATLTQNLWKPLPPGWWFAVSWSLAIEEWFYLLFGCAVFAYCRVFRAPWAIWPPVLFFILAPLLLRLAFPSYPGAMTLAPFRLDEIAYGVAMAQLYAQRSVLFRHPWTCLGLGLGLIGMIWSGHGIRAATVPTALIYSLTIIGCALLLPAAVALSSLPRPLARLATAVSAQSYALYLVHLTILQDVAQRLFAFKVLPLWACIALALGAPFLISWLSVRFLETPILRWRPVHPQPAQTGARPLATIERLPLIRTGPPLAEVRDVA